jgi:hypothetical protein
VIDHREVVDTVVDRVEVTEGQEVLVEHEDEEDQADHAGEVEDEKTLSEKSQSSTKKLFHYDV